MVKICKNFGTDFNVTLNPKKTVCIKSGSNISESDELFIDGHAIEWKNHVKYLGNIVNSTLTDEKDCALQISSFICAVNKLMGNYGGLQTEMLIKLFNSYCCSFYGSYVWHIKSPGFS